MSRLYVEYATGVTSIPNKEWLGGVNAQGQPDKTIPGNDPQGHPQWVKLSPIQAYAAAKPHAEKALICYDGLVNRSPVWSDSNGNLIDYGAAGSGPQVDATNPLDLNRFRAVANLAMHPAKYAATVDPFRPIVFDLESSGLMTASNADPVAKRRAMYQAYIDAITAMKALNFNLAIYILGYPWRQSDHVGGLRHNDGCEDLDKKLASLVNGAIFGAYNYDPDVLSGGTTWYDRVEGFERLLAREYPDLLMNKIAFMMPCYQVYYQKDFVGDWAPYAKLANTPVNFDLWTRQNAYLISKGFDRFLWLNNPLWELELYKAHIDAVI